MPDSQYELQMMGEWAGTPVYMRVDNKDATYTVDWFSGTWPVDTDDDTQLECWADDDTILEG